MAKQIIECPFNLEALRQSVAGCVETVESLSSEENFDPAEQSAQDGWSISAIDPAKALAVLPKLRLVHGWKLVGFQFRSGGNGNGAVYAVPADTVVSLADCFPKAKEFSPGVELSPPRPNGSAGYFMDVVEATEGGFEALFHASILMRELTEFGARWHGCSWGTHTILSGDPWESPCSGNAPAMGNRESWRFDQVPFQWRPMVCLEADEATVTFLTYSGLERSTIYRHCDHYRLPSLNPKSEQMEIGVGPAGYIF